MKLGYARVSTGEQNLALQIDALRASGAEKIFKDTGVSGSTVLKPSFAEMLRHARAGDEVRIPTIPPTHSDLKPPTIPSNFRPGCEPDRGVLSWS